MSSRRRHAENGRGLWPGSLGILTLRNRLVRAGCYEGLARAGSVTEGLVEHHRPLAAGGMGMTTLGYCAVSADGRGFPDELWMRDALVPQLEDSLPPSTQRVRPLRSSSCTAASFPALRSSGKGPWEPRASSACTGARCAPR